MHRLQQINSSLLYGSSLQLLHAEPPSSHQAASQQVQHGIRQLGDRRVN